MNKLLTKSIAALLFLYFMYTDVPVFGQIINSESFDGTTFPPAGWTISGAPNSLWVRRTTGTNPVCTTNSGAGMARFTAFMVQGGSQELMTSPVIDYSGASGSVPTFSLWVYRDNSSTAGDSVSIYVNTVNTLTGATRIGGVARSRFFVLPVNELANGWYNYSFNVPLSFNTDTNYILLNGTAHGGGNIYIDDVQWTEYHTACAGNPVAGSITAGTTLICGGAGSTTLSLTDSSLANGGLSFQWQSAPDSTGPWTSFGTSSNSVNSGTLSSSTYFRCYVSCANGTTTDTSSFILVQVNPNPPPTVTLNQGPTVNMCSGASPVIFVANGALNYTWNPNIAINATGDSASASPLTTTTYTVTGMDSIGCSGSTAVTVNVAPSPVVTATSNQDTLCSGQSTMLHAFVQGPGFGIQYVWQPGPLTGANQTITPTSTTMYIVAATSQMNGCTGYDSVEVVVLPTPVAGFSFTVNNLTYSFTDNSSGSVTSWLWNFGDGNTDTVQNPVHTYSANGTYTVTLTVSDGNCTNVFTQIVTVVSVSHLQLPDGSQLSVYPNPVSDITTVEFRYDIPFAELTVINPLGQSVISKTIYPASGKIFKSNLDMSKLPKGNYILQVKAKSESVFIQLNKL